MALKIRRGTEAQRSSVQFALGELVWTTDTYRLYVGDGIEAGGHSIAKNIGGTGLAYNAGTGRLDVDYNGLNSDQVTEGSNNLFFSVERAQDAVANALVTGNTYNIGITFLYDDVNGWITATVNNGAGLPNQTAQGGKYLTTNGSVATWADVTATGITSVHDDTAPTLGGNLTLNNHNIVGTGNINVTGTVTASQFSVSSLSFTSQANITGGPVNFLSAPANFINTGPTPGSSFVSFLTASNDALIAPLNIAKSRGTVFSPQPVQNNDKLGRINGTGWTGSAFTVGSSITSVVDGTVSVGVLPTRLEFGVNNSAGDEVIAVSIKSKHVDFAVAPVLPVYADDTARDAAITTRVAGMIVLNGTTFQGWNGSAWVNFN